VIKVDIFYTLALKYPYPMIKHYILIFTILFYSISIKAIDQQEVDSLKLKLSQTNVDTLIFDYNYTIAHRYIKIAPDTSLKYINNALGVIDKHKYPNRYFNAINVKGASFWFDNEMDSAACTYRKGLEFSKQLADTNMYAKIANNIGVTFQYNGKIDSAEKYLLIARDAYKAVDNKKALAKASLDLGGLYTTMSKYNLAIEELLIGLDVFKGINDTLYLINGYNSIGNLYSNIDKAEDALNAYKKSLDLIKRYPKVDISDELYCNIGLLYFQTLNKYDSAEYYFQKALSKEGIENNNLLYATVLVNLATLKNNQKDYNQALKYFNIVKNMDENDVEPITMMACLINLGSTYLEMGNSIQARKNLDEGLRRAISLNSLEFQKNAYKYLSLCDSVEGDFASAYSNYKKFHSIDTKIHNAASEKQLLIISSKHKLKEIETQNEYLEQQNTLKQDLLNKHITLNRIAALAFVLTFLIFIFTLFLYKKSKALNTALKSKNEEITNQREEVQVLNSQLNKLISIIAHDLKAPFNSLLGLLSELANNPNQYSEDEKNAIIKALLENTKSTYNLLENLMQWSVSQSGLLTMNIEKIRLATILDEALKLNRIQIENKLLIIKNELNPHVEVYADRKMTFTIFTNLISNAIKFNYPGGMIRIKSKNLTDKVQVIISDEGVGIPKEYIDSIFSIASDYQMRGTENEYGTGLGLKVVAEFIRRMNGSVRAESNEKGTSFIFELPTTLD